MGMQDISNDAYDKMTAQQREDYWDQRRRAQNEVDRRRLLKIPMFLVREVILGPTHNGFLIIKRHVNKKSAGLFVISEKLSSYYQTHHANYQADGVNGKYMGFYFERGQDLDFYPRTIMQDLYDYAHGDLTPLENRYGGRFDQNRFKWEL